MSDPPSVTFNNVKVFTFENVVNLKTGTQSVNLIYTGNTGSPREDLALYQLGPTLQNYAQTIFNNPQEFLGNQRVSSVTFSKNFFHTTPFYIDRVWIGVFQIEYIRGQQTLVNFYLSRGSVWFASKILFSMNDPNFASTIVQDTSPLIHMQPQEGSQWN